MPDKIVSIGLLTQRDLDALGHGFKRHYPLNDDRLFDDLIAKLDALTARDTRSTKPRS